MSSDWKNRLYYGDNLAMLRSHVEDASVDLIYLDPPFNSKATYNVLFKEKSGEESAAQITAFEDTWHWGMESELAYREVVREGPRKLGELLQAMRSFLGQNDMMAYLTMMAQRMAELRRVLKPTGSIYLHCDPTASHYLKILMDATFGARNFKTEIIWKRSSAHSDTKQGRAQHGQIHDVILFYTKGETWTWNPSMRLTIKNILMISTGTSSRKRGGGIGWITCPPPGRVATRNTNGGSSAAKMRGSGRAISRTNGKRPKKVGNTKAFRRTKAGIGHTPRRT